MAPDTEVRPSPPVRRSVRFQWWWIVAAAAVVVTVFAATRMIDRPSTIDRVFLVNDTDNRLHVEVAAGEPDGWMSVGTAERRATTTIEEVIDQGAVWTIRFTSDGVVVAEQRIARADLARNGWRIVVPPEVESKLPATTVTPST